jgi:hypothetical protein
LVRVRAFDVHPRRAGAAQCTPAVRAMRGTHVAVHLQDFRINPSRKGTR